MRIRSSLAAISAKALYESLPVEMMVRLADRFIPGYDAHERTGYPLNIPIPAQEAARRVVADAIVSERYLDFVEALIDLDRRGFMGKPYPVSGIRDICKAVAAEGYAFDQGTGLFMEDPRVRRSSNWGRLHEGEEAMFAFLRLDIVKNSELVRSHGAEAAARAYADLREIVARASESRGGRVWAWEGDGGLVAFRFGHQATAAALTGMSILHELFLYNRFSNRIGSPLKIREAAHAGLAHWSPLESEIKKLETVKETVEIESSMTPPDALAISSALAPSLDRVIQERFRASKGQAGHRVFVYSIEMEEP